MAELQDFNLKVKPELSQFQTEETATGIKNRATIAQVAGHGAALNVEGDPIINYRAMVAEIEQTGNSRLLDKIRQDFKNREYLRGKDALITLLADPSTTQEIREAAIKTFDEEFVNVDMRQMVSEEAVISGSSTVNSPETEEIEDNLIGSLKLINDQNKELEAQINASKVVGDDDSYDKIVDFVELLIPFAEGKQVGNILGDLRQASGKDRELALGKALVLMGQSKKEIVETFKKVPPLQRLEAGKLIIDIIENNQTLILPDGNDISSLTLMKQALNLETYTDIDQFVDNAVSILDVLGLTGIAARVLGKGGKAALDAEKIRKHTVTTDVSPTSISQNYKDTNTDKARAAYEAAVKDEEAAKVLYGTDSTKAAANDLLPSVGYSDGTVKSKLSRPNLINDLETSPDPEVLDFANRKGYSFLADKEKEQMRTIVSRNFKDAAGLTTKDEMFTIQATDDGVRIMGYYGPSDGGFANPIDALEHVKFAFREYGIDEENLTLLMKRGGVYQPITLKELSLMQEISSVLNKKGATALGTRQPIDYIVGVDYHYKFNPTDLTPDFENLTVKYNVFNRFSLFSSRNGRGSLDSHILDNDSMFDPRLTSSFNALNDKSGALESLLNRLGSEFAKPYSKLPADRRTTILGLIKEANANGIEHTDAQLIAAGLDEKEIEMMHAWRNAWDTQWHLENADKAKTLRAQGVKVFVDPNSDTRLFGRTINQYESIRAYDPETGKVENFSPEDLNELYKRGKDEKGGTIVELLMPIEINGTPMKYIKVSQTKNGGYLRTINDDDQVLNYRKGYYQIQYKDPIFIKEVVRKKDGSVESSTAIATARNIQEGKHLIERLKATKDPNKIVDYEMRTDKKGTASYAENDFEVSLTSGRTAQKFRGKRLESANSSVMDPTQENILDPIDALTRASRTLSDRVMIREAIEFTREKFLRQFEDLLPKEKGRTLWPKNSSEIGTGNILTNDKRLADARSLYEYINTMENGYVNSLDDGFKAIINQTANMLGKVDNRALQISEAGLRKIAEVGPTSLAKNLSFKLYLSTAPLRQALIQGHQTIQLAAVFPKYATTKMIPQAYNLFIAANFGAEAVPKAMLKLAGQTTQEVADMLQDFRNTGLWESVDKHNFIRENLRPLADVTVAGKIKSAVDKPFGFAQKIGFDKGEQVTQITSWLAHRNRALENGENLKSAAVQEKIQGDARAFTFSMNRAGDMAYNQNHLGILMQYMQVPHKAILQMTTNRHLTKGQKAKLILWNSVMYGTPATIGATYLTNLAPENRDWVDFVNFGLLTLGYNKLLSTVFQEEVKADFSDLAPTNIAGIGNIIETIWQDGLIHGLTESPAGSLIFGGNPRLTTLAKTAARYFNLTDDYSDGTEFHEVVQEAAHMFSGYGHFFKAAYALETGKKVNSLGGVTDPNVNTVEAVLAAFGFKTLDEARNTKILEHIYSGDWGRSKEFEDDVKTWYKDYKRHLFREGITPGEVEFTIRAATEALRVFNKFGEKRVREILSRERLKDVRAGDFRIYEQVLKSIEFKDIDEVRAEAALLPDELRQAAFDYLDLIERGEN